MRVAKRGTFGDRRWNGDAHGVEHVVNARIGKRGSYVPIFLDSTIQIAGSVAFAAGDLAHLHVNAHHPPTALALGRRVPRQIKWTSSVLVSGRVDVAQTEVPRIFNGFPLSARAPTGDNAHLNRSCNPHSHGGGWY